ncbi:hypothetical protein DFS34DRAFT_597689 [Phlyctochytrium arcticum]|nr:hypothetical protein DFS34DRAFT_597689 [Phlyctochytrium arcticum]
MTGGGGGGDAAAAVAAVAADVGGSGGESNIGRDISPQLVKGAILKVHGKFRGWENQGRPCPGIISMMFLLPKSLSSWWDFCHWTDNAKASAETILVLMTLFQHLVETFSIGTGHVCKGMLWIFNASSQPLLVASVPIADFADSTFTGMLIYIRVTSIVRYLKLEEYTV